MNHIDEKLDNQCLNTLRRYTWESTIAQTKISLCDAM